MRLYIKRAIQDIRRNRFLNVVTVVTIALATLIVSAFALFFINTSDLMNTWKEGLRIMVYLNPKTAQKEIPDLKDRMLNMYGVETVRFIPKDQALAELKAQLQHQSSLLENLKANPLPDAFEVRLVSTSRSWDRIEKLAREIAMLPAVDDVEYGQRWIGKFTNIFNLFRLAGYALGALFFMAAVFFVANTIRLVLYSRRDEVDIMRLVGAEDSFIRTPFYIEAIIQGALGGIIGLGALFVIFLFIQSNVNTDPALGTFQIRFLDLELLLSVLLAGMLVGWLGCFVSLKQFLKA
jgi:cell division transport system permease protein